MIENNRYLWSHLKMKGAMVRVSPKKPEHGLVFSVKNMIDLGRGRQTVVLEHVENVENCRHKKKIDASIVPFSMGELDFVYASNRIPSFQDVHNLFSTLYKGASIEKIVVDILSPGDLLVFKQDKDTMRINIDKVLRIVKDMAYKKNNERSNTGYAI